MNHQQLCDKLIELGFDLGWGVRNGEIVLWENETDVPDELQDFVNLD